MIQCPQCGKQFEDGTQICTCGALLVDMGTMVATRSLDNSQPEDPDETYGTAQFTMRTRLVLHIEGKDDPLALAAAEIERIILGRTDPSTGYLPDINLTPYDALEKGVSRRHAAIVYANRALRLYDLDSANGTYVNGNRLAAQKPRILRDGDDIRLGQLGIQVAFERIR